MALSQNISLEVEALGMSIVGAVGMFMSGLVQPIFGGLIDSNRATAAAQGLEGDALNVAAGQMTMTTMTMVPAVLILLFGILYFWVKGRSSENVAMAH